MPDLRSWWASATPRERDAMVAEKVMGWKVFHSKHGHFEITKPDGTRLSAFFMYKPPKYDPETGEKLPESQWWNDWSCDIPDYMGEISAAFEVVEKMKAEKWTFYLEMWPSCEWSARFGRPGNEQADHVSTAPEAICLAALLAVKAEP